MGRHEEALKILHGGTVIPAIPLVLDENRKFNEAGQRTLIRYYLDAGVGGLAVAVHTTQFEIRKPEVGLFEPVPRDERGDGRIRGAHGENAGARGGRVR